MAKQTKVWVDEMPSWIDASDDARLAPFFLACMLRYGDPDNWLNPFSTTETERQFYAYTGEFIQDNSILYTKKDLMASYMIWYDREKSKLPTVDTRRKVT